MKHALFILFISTLTMPGFAQQYLGLFEVGDPVEFLLIAADPETGSPTDPVDLSYTLRSNGASLTSGTMSIIDTGISSASIATTGLPTGRYDVLISGIVSGVTAHAYKSFSLLPSGSGIPSIASHVAGLGGTTPLSASAYLSYHDQLLDEIRIASRNISRARLWFAQNTIDTVTRSVPADMASHMEIQVAAPDDPDFATPLATYYRVYYYPDSVSSTKPSKETRTETPPLDGIFYRVPALDW